MRNFQNIPNLRFRNTTITSIKMTASGEDPHRLLRKSPCKKWCLNLRLQCLGHRFQFIILRKIHQRNTSGHFMSIFQTKEWAHRVLTCSICLKMRSQRNLNPSIITNTNKGNLILHASDTTTTLETRVPWENANSTTKLECHLLLDILPREFLVQFVTKVLTDRIFNIHQGLSDLCRMSIIAHAAIRRITVP